MRIEPQRLVCAFHQAQRRADSPPSGWHDWVGWARSLSLSQAKVLDPLRRIYAIGDEAWREMQSLMPEDVRPGFVMVTSHEKPVKSARRNGSNYAKAEPWGRLLAVFHDYTRKHPTIYALSDGTAKGIGSAEQVLAREAAFPQRCQRGCGTEQTATGLLWLLRRLFGAPADLTVRPSAVEDAVDVAEVWNLIRRDGSGDWGMDITGAGRIWLLAHCRMLGEELVPSAAKERPIQNFIDARWAQDVNVNFNQGNIGQGNVNFGTQGPVAQGNAGPVDMGNQQTTASADVGALTQVLSLIYQHQQQLSLNQDQAIQLQRAMRELQESITTGDPSTPAAARASRTILALTKDTLAKVAPSVTLAVLEKVAGLEMG